MRWEEESINIQIINRKVEIITATKEIKIIMQQYFAKHYDNLFESLEEKITF